MRPSQEALCHTPLLGPQGDRSRPHLSLREGSEKILRRSDDAPEKGSMRWQNPIPVLRALGRHPAGPMNWRNPIRVAAVLGWPVIRVAALGGWISPALRVLAQGHRHRRALCAGVSAGHKEEGREDEDSALAPVMGDGRQDCEKDKKGPTAR